MSNIKLPTQFPGELEHALKCRGNLSCTLNNISNTLPDARKRRNIGKYSLYKGNIFREKHPFRVYNKAKCREIVEEVTKNINYCHNCGSADHYATSCPKAKTNIYAIEKAPEEEPKEDYSESESMGDAIRENSNDNQDQIEEFLVEYQEEIQLEAGLPQENSNKNVFKNTQDAQAFLVTPSKRMVYIHGTATRMTVCIYNAQHPFIADSGAHFSIVARECLDKHFPNWEKKLFPTKEKKLKVHQER
ncbi:hypothetical protein O181_039774 [Austropuccinia psidii MF-1]|uniref:CCHC-type domain-containing protein n=1 Tax=Austropuccinia psidii MF-1 TaxID=1389203 RepID=A0A9Q3DAZ0_9BASI|nr:hypothetical protein [Austropuccinia psidii MF-1]